MRYQPAFFRHLWIMFVTVALMGGCSTQEPTDGQPPKTAIDKPPSKPPTPKVEAIRTKPQASLCEFSQLYAQIQYEYDLLHVERRPKKLATLTTAFNFVEWRPSTQLKLPGQVKKAYWSKETQDYFRFEHFGGRDDDLELYVVLEDDYKLVFPHVPNAYDSPDSNRRIVSGRWDKVHAFPDVPGCFIQMPAAKYIYYVTGADDDGTIFSPPFSDISQAISIYLCDGSLWPKYRIGFFNGKSSFVGTYKKRNSGLVETYSRIQTGAYVELDSICLQKIEQLPNRSKLVAEEPYSDCDSEMPDWLINYGTAKYTPKFIHSNNRIVK